MGKGEIVCYEQFLLFPQCFQKACFPGVSKGVIVWEWVNGSVVKRGTCDLEVFGSRPIGSCLIAYRFENETLPDGYCLWNQSRLITEYLRNFVMLSVKKGTYLVFIECF